MRSAIHICSGDQASEALVDRWLLSGDLSVQRFEDVYSACVYLVRNPDSPPDLVAVGASWLTRDELAIIAYVEQTWPAAPLVVYGLSDDAGRIGASQRVRVCRSSAELRVLLEQLPADLAASAPESADNPPLSADHNDLSSETPPGSDADDADRGSPIAPRPCAEPEPSKHPDALDDVELTREELAALLEDAER
jgi:hypothetical protein